jgi:hypothetical protein
VLAVSFCVQFDHISGDKGIVGIMNQMLCVFSEPLLLLEPWLIISLHPLQPLLPF